MPSAPLPPRQTDRGPQLVPQRNANPSPALTDSSSNADDSINLDASDRHESIFFKANPIPMWVFDRQSLLFLAVNHAAIRQYQYSEDEFLEMTIREIRPPGDIPKLLTHLKSEQPGLQDPEHWKHRRKDGSILDVEIVSHDLDYVGHQAALVAAFDVTDRLRSEMLLRESEAKYRVLFEESADAHWLVDENNIVECNAAALEMFGLPKEERFRRPVDMSPPFQPDGRPSPVAAEKFIASAFSEGRASFEWVHKRSNGELFPAEVHLSAIKLAERNLMFAVMRDITERKRDEESLRLKTALLEAQSETTIDGILVVDENDRVISFNHQFSGHFGVPAELLTSGDDLAVRRFVSNLAQDPVEFRRQIEYLSHHPMERFSDELQLKDGRSFERFSTPLYDSEQRYRGRIWYFHDVTRTKKMEAATLEAQQKYRTLFEDAVIGIFRATPEGRPVTINRALARIHGFDSSDELLAEVSHAGLQLFVDPDDMARLAQSASADRPVQNAEVEVLTKSHQRRWIRVNCHAVRNASGEVKYIDGTTEDITDRKLAEKQVEALAYYDTLTGLPNRSLLHDRIAQALARSHRTNDKIAILFVDLDRFKLINDSLGHSIGDLLLKEIATRLGRCVREGDTIARIGGDEFVIVLASIHDTKDIEVAASRVLSELATPFMIDGYTLHATCSVGISLYPDNGSDRETLIRYADQAMYSAKESGRNTYRFFSAKLNERIQERTSIERDLRLALQRSELFLVYQPQMVLETQQPAGLEALLRWRHPQKGLIPPSCFIEIAESTGLILPVGEWLLRAACHQAKDWLDRGLLHVPVAVNISAVQFRQSGFPELIGRILKETALLPEMLELELTESLLLSDGDSTLAVLRKLREMGVQLAIDDFGTGYSNLSYLKKFQVKKLKIDRSFIQDLTRNADDAAITAAIIQMSKALNLQVIAEGVECPDQLEFLCQHQCDGAQGYIFSKPLMPVEIENFLSIARGPLAAPVPEKHSMGRP